MFGIYTRCQQIDCFKVRQPVDNIPLYFTGITTYIQTELAPKITATASVAQSVGALV